MGKTVLVTGSAGFIGSHFAEHVIKNTDWKVIGLDSFKHRGDTERTRHLPKDRYQIITHDLNAPISHRTIDYIGPIDYVVAFASDSHVERSITDPVPFAQNNTNLALHTLEYARQIKPQKLVWISTDEVYGAAPEGVQHAEWSEILPSNVYSASKASQEALAIAYWRTYGVPVQITNTMNNFGERQDPEKFVPMCISKIHRGETVVIHGNERSVGSRFYLHARNHADAVLFLLKEMQTPLYQDDVKMVQRPHRFNVVGDIEMDNLSLAKLIAEIMGKPLNYELVDFHAARPGHDRRYALDGTKLANLGWKAPLSFEESLRRTVAWTLKHPMWMK